MVETLSKKLEGEGISAVKLHGDMPQPERKRIMEAVKSKASTLLIATDVAARGIDIENVEAVFNYDVPQESEWYVHRIGRTGRAGKSGAAYSIVNTIYQFNQLKKIEQETGNKLKEYYSTFSKTHADKAKVSPAKKKDKRNSLLKKERPAKHGKKPDFGGPKKGGKNQGKKSVRQFKKSTTKNYSAIKTSGKKPSKGGRR
jgi:superfamily II DNA/RNA helicase